MSLVSQELRGPVNVEPQSGNRQGTHNLEWGIAAH